MACFDNIIGLSRSDCPCVDVAPPTDYNTSLSGLFISDVPPLNEMEGYNECGTGSVWDVQARARAQATKTFIADSNSALMATFKSRRERFVGQIGEASGRELLSSSRQYAGVQIACNPLRGGTMKITHIGTLFSGVGTIEASIINSLNQVVWTGDLNIANGWTLNVLAEPIELPLFIEFDTEHQYFLVYEHNPTNPARINSIGSCGSCGFHPYYDTRNPMWGKPYSGPRAWANWVMVGGWTGDTLTDFDEAPTTTGAAMNGIAIKAELGCNVGQVLCNGELDFANDPLAMSIAYAIYWKTCEIAATLFLGSTALTRAKMVNREFVKEARAEFAQKYEKNLAYIAQEASANINDCLICRDETGFRVETVYT